MQSDMLAKCIAISQSHFLNVPYKDLTIDQIYGVDGIGNKASRICHYCSVDVLKNILENESLRFSDVRFLNDSTEFIEIIPLVKYVAQHEEYASEFIDMILNDSLIKELESYRQPYIGKEKNTQNYAEKVYRTYTCSFSTNKDSLTMWNYYATSGSGVNLIFDFAWNLFEGSDISEVNNSSHLENDITICRGLVLYQRMDKQKCIKALLDNLYEVYLQEDTIEKCQSHIQWAFKEAINNMRCFFKNDSFSCENEYRVILKIPEELLLEETTGQDGILKKGQFKRGNILIPYVDYKFKRDSLKGITLNPYVKEKESVFELGIRELLWQNKIHNVQIYRSAIDRRRRQNVPRHILCYIRKFFSDIKTLRSE